MKKIKPILLSILIVLMTSIGFFISFYPNTVEQKEAFADITGVSGEVINLTAKFGTTPTHYFKDENDNSTLVKARVPNDENIWTRDDEYYYVNEKGESVCDYYIIEGNTTSRGSSYGDANYYLTEDMKKFAEKGILYVQASAGVISGKDSLNSNLEISVIQGNSKQSVNSDSSKNGTNIEQWIKTDFIQVNAEDCITFHFTSLDKGTLTNACEFKLLEPKLIFKVVVNEVKIEDETEKVGPGQILKLNATNDVLGVKGSSEYLKYYRSIHKVEYEIISGKEYAEIIDGYLYFTEEDINATVTVVAKSKKDSLSDELIQSEPKNYIISNEKIDVQIDCEFNDCINIYGEGKYHIGENIVLSFKLKDRFKFEGWLINGKEESSRKVIYTVGEENNIKCKISKSIFVSAVELDEKIYDGSTVADCRFILDGVEFGHEVYLTGLVTNYDNADVGENKTVVYDGSPELGGKDVELYRLDESKKIPTVVGTIKKKDVNITTQDMTKTYGDIDETIAYTSDNEHITGKLDRAEGEDVGKYLINIGDLNEINTNYNCILVGQNYYTINKRVITLDEIKVKEKIYDKTNSAEVESYALGNVISSDEISLNLEISFTDYNAGEREIKIEKCELIGDKKNNYSLSILNTVFKSKIKQKPIDVTAKKGESVYGDDIKLEYETSGLINGDILTGKLAINGDDVGSYLIQQNTLDNSNYQINFIGAEYTIKKRDIKITVKPRTKTYGDGDPELEYEVENLVVGEKLEGSLEREEGEDVGSYKITKGTLSGANYNFVSFTENTLTIEARKVGIEIIVNDKIYDGNKNATFSSYFINVAEGDEIKFYATMEFEDAVAGVNKKVNILTSYYESDKLDNYLIEGVFENLKATIKRKDVLISIDKKQIVYGDQDVSLTYKSEGVLDGENIIGELSREEGRDAGSYEILLNTINNENNINYNIISKNKAYYTISKVNIEVQAIANEKIYGEEDPVFTYKLKDSSKLKYEDSIENIFEGHLSREEGSLPGKYLINIGSLNCPKNYNIERFSEEYFTINKRNIIVSASDVSKVYGDDDPEFTYNVQNLVEGDRLSLKLKREYGENVGSYAITYTSLNDLRYNISFENSELNITPRNIKVKADDKYKVYGEEDPLFTVSIVEGTLENGDELESIQTGNMSRIEGNDVGSYDILEGSYSLGSNYTIDFTSGNLNIIKAEITVKSDIIYKKYGNNDGELTYTITAGSLKYKDSFSGELIREEGEVTGEYKIQRGTLTVNDNYNLTFIAGKLIIEKREIVVTADTITKYYGDPDPELTYTIDQKLFNGDTLFGSLEREKQATAQDDKAYEKTGKYLISSNLYSSNYEITFIPAYLIIQRREITIVADNKEKTYGEDDPELTYYIQNGSILEGDALSGNIYRIAGDNAGKYDIRSNLTLGRNYKINFVKGIFTINPIDIYVKTYDYEKTYGELNPTFEYEITSGELLDGDVLLGGVSKESGENVGKYRLVSAFNNVNYNVILTENYMTINPKNAYLSVNIQDKVYNGNCVAYIKNPVVTGLIDDDVKLSFDKENSARFETPEIGNNIKVEIYDVILVGEKAGNYNLIYPTNLKANITHDKLSDEENRVLLVAKTNTTLNQGTQVIVEEESFDTESLVNTSKQIISYYTISLEENSSKKDLKDSIKISLALPKEYRDRSNYYVYGRGRDGEFQLLTSTRVGDYLEVETDTLGEFVILSDNELWLDIGSYISIGVIGAFALYFVIRIIVKKARKKKTA